MQLRDDMNVDWGVVKMISITQQNNKFSSVDSDILLTVDSGSTDTKYSGQHASLLQRHQQIQNSPKGSKLYNEVRRLVKQVISQPERGWEENIATNWKTNSKSFNKCIKKEIRSGIRLLIDSDGSFVTILLTLQKC